MRTAREIHARIAEYKKALEEARMEEARAGTYTIPETFANEANIINRYTIARSMSAIAELEWILDGEPILNTHYTGRDYSKDT